MLTVNQLSKSAQVTPDAIRHYVRIGLLKAERHPLNGYKLFMSDDVKKVKFIRVVQGLGFTLRDIQRILDEESEGLALSPSLWEIIQRRVVENKNKLAELSAMQLRMENALLKWKTLPEGTADINAITYLLALEEVS